MSVCLRMYNELIEIRNQLYNISLKYFVDIPTYVYMYVCSFRLV